MKRRRKGILEKSDQSLRKQIKGKLIGEISEISGSGFGEALYFRPFREDELMIEEIAQVTDEKKSAIAQKLLHLVLSTAPSESARENRQLELLEWLVAQEKLQAVKRDERRARLERLEESIRELENSTKKVAKNTRFTRKLVSEIYCLTTICMTFSNQIFTRVIEYFSPVEIERKNSTDFANRNILGLVEHALAELEKLSEFHQAETGEIKPEMLYLFTKIEKIRGRLLPPPVSAGPSQK